jgi:predicted ATPase
MISKVSVRNFKCLRDVRADLERFTVFVGPNASGKSSIVQALDLLCRRFRIDHPQNLDSELLPSLSRGATDQIALGAETGGQAFRYRTHFPSLIPRPLPDAGMQGIVSGQNTAASLAASDWAMWNAKPPGSVPLPLSVLLRLEASKLVQPNPGVPDPTVMSPEGVGLHSALASMALNDPDSWQALQDNLRRIIPSIRRLRHTKTSNIGHPTALLFDTVGADSVPADQVSEGTLLVLGMLTALHALGRPSLVLLDDLDRGLHPRAQKELITLLRGLLDTNSDLQIVATTHSPYMLDCMGVNEVRICFLNEDDGATVCAPLTSHPKYPKWKAEMTPGEMWSLFGEKWIVEGVTA